MAANSRANLRPSVDSFSESSDWLQATLLKARARLLKSFACIEIHRCLRGVAAMPGDSPHASKLAISRKTHVLPWICDDPGSTVTSAGGCVGYPAHVLRCVVTLVILHSFLSRVS